MAAEPIDDIEAWSQKLSMWRRDCLRRLAISNELTDKDYDELLDMVKLSAGVSLDGEPPTPIPFSKEHFGGGKQQLIVLRGLANVEGVNRLAPKASLNFCPKALTIVYGRNGSGKSGFVRVLRTACRTRVDNPAKLKVLADVYGDGLGPQAAEIVIDAGAGDVSIAWSPGKTAAPQLMQVGVFDTASAQLYVDGGNQIRYLPFGLALPHRLNGVCLVLKAKLDAERAISVGDKVSLTAIVFGVQRNTAAQAFDKGLTAATTNPQILAAATFTAANEARLEALTGVLAAGVAAAADLQALIGWVEGLKVECVTVAAALSDEALATLSDFKAAALSTRQAAQLAASELFTDEPLPGVGSESWRALWAAARDYSVSEAYAGQEFPVVTLDASAAACVLCQQPLPSDGAARMLRFQTYMDNTLGLAASKAERTVEDAIAGLPELKLLNAADLNDRLDQVRTRDSVLCDAISTFQASVLARRADGAGRLAGEASASVPPLIAPIVQLESLASKLHEEKDTLESAADAVERSKLLTEKAELEDRRTLANNCLKLTIRRDLKLADAAYAKALTEVSTTGTTKRANDFLDTHLTKAVIKQFDAERERFDIMHVRVGLARKSGQTMAEYEVDPQTKLTKLPSEILSEGEQRALALAGFLTEVTLTDGSGPIIIDDPVSSLDRDRSTRVAERIVEEATNRQVIVFTHDIIFFNELCRAADVLGIEPVTVALFSDKDAAGKIDQAGMVWKGLTVAKRIGRIKADFAPLAKLHAISPAEYEYRLKNIYGRLRDTFERMVEEVIFRDIVRRGVDVVQTQLLRYVTLPDDLAIRFHNGMTRANTHSHDNPAADTVTVPTPDEFATHVTELETLIDDFKKAHEAAEAARPTMKPKKYP